MTGPQLRATRDRPADATLAYSFRLYQNRRAFWLLQTFSTALFFLFGWFFLWWALQLRPGLVQDGAFAVPTSKLILVLLVSAVIAIILHELIHGACFWIFSRARPIFGFRVWYAYAAAPGWYFPRRQYLVIGLAPFLLLSALGMLLLPIVPAGALLAILFGTVTNAAGAAGDLWTIWMLLRERRRIVVEDLGDGFNFYALPD